MPTHYENPRALEPKRGTPLLPWWRRFVRWAETLPVIVGPNVRVTLTPLGMKVMVRTSSPVRTPFRVSRRGLDLRISVGTVDGEVPWIEYDRSAAGGHVRLDGDRAHLNPDPVPVSQVAFLLSAKDAPALDSDGRSYLVIGAHLQRMRDRDLSSPGLSSATLLLEHLLDLSPTALNLARANSGAAYHTLAVLYWSPDRTTIERIGQVTHHNLQLLEDDEGIGYYAAT